MVDPAAETLQGAETAPPADGAAVSAWHPDHAWVWQVTALSIGLGILLALAIRTTERIRVSNDSARLGVSTAFLSRYKEQNARLQEEMVELRRQKDAYISSMNSDSQATEDLKRQFEELKAIGGISADRGPGVEITVRDNTGPLLPGDEPGNFALNLVHDQDLINIINELKTAGSTKIAIAGADASNLQRVIVTTTARCVGPTAIVNGIPLSAPYRIVALGDPAALKAALERPESYVRARKLDERKMLSIREDPNLTVPEYSGTLNPRYARPFVEKEKGEPTG